MKTNCQSGFIMILTLLIVSLSVALATYLANRGTLFTPYARTIVEREKAKYLALSGIQIAMSQLAEPFEPKKKEKTDQEASKEAAQQKPDASQLAKHLLSSVLPHLNQWQTFALDETVDGVEGEIKIAISSEDGKINLNELADLYDFEKNKFKIDVEKKGGKEESKLSKAWRALLEKTGINVFEIIGELAKGRQEYKLNDVTELILKKDVAKKFAGLEFYQPPDENNKKKEKRRLNLTDIFTTWSPTVWIEPWLFSSSIASMLGLKQTKKDEGKKRESNVKNWLENFKLTSDWQKDWDTILAPVYGKDFKSLPAGIELILSKKFDSSIFSVLSYGKVGKISQRFFAILERTQKASKKNDDGKVAFEVKMKKLYWL